MSQREKAQAMIDGGWRVVPITPKRKWPYAKKWQNKVFCSADFGENDGIGIVTGHGVIAIDIDVYCPDISEAIRDEAFRRFNPTLERVGQPPKSALLYRAPAGIEKKTLNVLPTGNAPDGKTDGIEILGKGQQCVADGIHPDTGKPYKWVGLEPWDNFIGGIEYSLPEITEAQIDDFLAWIDEVYGVRGGVKTPKPNGVTDGIFDLDLAVAAQPLDISDEKVRQLLLDVPAAGLDYDGWCKVGMALAHQYQKSEVGLKLWDDWSKLDAERYKPNELPKKWQSFGNNPNPTTIATAMHMAKKVGPTRTTDKGFRFVPVAALEYRAPEFVIDGLIETETLGLVFGDPGCGKSFLAVDIALSVASGTPFHGRDVKQGPVFFIAGEGHNGLARRFAAWSKDRGVDLEKVPLFKSTRSAQFLDGPSADAMAECVEDLANAHGQPRLIIIDTLARNFGAGDENSTQDMSNFVTAMDDLQERFPKCTVLIVHHSGHGEKSRARGAMALKGALDLEYRVEKNDAVIKLINTKMKDAEEPPDQFFELVGVDLDRDASSAVLKAAEAPDQTRKMTPSQKMGLEAYVKAAKTDAIGEGGIFKGVHLEHWRDEFYKVHTGDNPEAKKKAFQRVRTDLVNMGQVTVSHDVYFAKDAIPVEEMFQELD